MTCYFWNVPGSVLAVFVFQWWGHNGGVSGKRLAGRGLGVVGSGTFWCINEHWAGFWLTSSVWIVLSYASDKALTRYVWERERNSIKDVLMKLFIFPGLTGEHNGHWRISFSHILCVPLSLWFLLSFSHFLYLVMLAKASISIIFACTLYWIIFKIWWLSLTKCLIFWIQLSKLNYFISLY